MKILIDTHIFLWALGNVSRLSAERREALEMPTNTVYVSVISMAELMIKASVGKLTVNFDPLDGAKKSGFELIDFSCPHAITLGTLPLHHRDPFDRMLIAQAITDHLYLMTDDEAFKQYECKIA
ncbi:MAG: type II toxin-antitoxin system VapC family toxin [Myxococcota bacterium]|nr:type II toxin-antitoxin system VapC family toxin [Myxococcota bacterium]